MTLQHNRYSSRLHEERVHRRLYEQGVGKCSDWCSRSSICSAYGVRVSLPLAHTHTHSLSLTHRERERERERFIEEGTGDIGGYDRYCVSCMVTPRPITGRWLEIARHCLRCFGRGRRHHRRHIPDGQEWCACCLKCSKCSQRRHLKRSRDCWEVLVYLHGS